MSISRGVMTPGRPTRAAGGCSCQLDSKSSNGVFVPRICWKLIGEFLNSARENDVMELRLLLDAHSILINALDAQGRNALSVAGGREAIEFLVEHGAVDPAAARRDATRAVKRYLATGDARRLVEHVFFYEVDWDGPSNTISSYRTPRCFIWRYRIRMSSGISWIGYPLSV